MISIIIPVLNEADHVLHVLKPLQKYRGKNLEIIVIDGGSDDSTIDLIKPYSDIVDVSVKGRAKQMNVGACKAQGNVLIFLHADTLLPENFIDSVLKGLSKDGYCWGRFDISLSGSAFSLRVIEFFINFRSRWSGIATGDQAIFVNSQTFHQLGGYQDIPLMEDVALSKNLKQNSLPVCLKDKVITSSRRWEKFGIWRTIILMWKLRLEYFFGADPHYLASKYE